MQDKKKKITIIVPVFDTEDYLEQCVRSLLAQTYSNLEILLIDDGSQDKCPDLCDAYASKDRRIRVIHKKNAGVSSAREVGIQSAYGEYILFVDSDDWIESDTIADCVEMALKNNAGCVMFGYVKEYPQRSIPVTPFGVEFSYDEPTSEEKIHRRIVGLAGDELKNPQQIDSLSSVCMKLYKTDVAKKGKIISERVVGTSEDTIFNLYALDGCKISYINKCFYHYRKSNARSITTQYKPTLVEKWDVMYDIMQEYINSSGRADEYHIPFLNRVACGMIGLGLNEIGSSETIWRKSQRLQTVLDKPLYQEAFKQLDISYCGTKWILFFLLCKGRHTFLLTMLLQVMNYLRSRMAI